MAADNYDALSASDNHARRVLALHWSMAVLAALVGVIGLLRGSWLTTAMIPRSYVHVLFGLLLWGLVLTRFRWWLKHSPPLQTSDVRDFSRQLSRMVYLLLYLVIGVRLCIGIVNSIWHGGGLDFGLLLDNVADAHDPGIYTGIYKPSADFQAFLACGLVALVLIRALAFRTWLRLVDGVVAAADHRGSGTRQG